MISKKTVLSLLALFVLCFIAFTPAKPSSATSYFPVPQNGEIIDAEGIKVMVRFRGVENDYNARCVLIYDYPDVNSKTLTIPNTVYANGYEWKVIGVLSGAFKKCVTPKTIIIDKNSSIDWYYMCPDAFINGSVQTIQVNPKDGEWDTLYPILEYNGPKSLFPLKWLVENISTYSDFKNTTNTEDTLYINVPKGTYTLKTYKANQDGEAGKELRVYSNTTLNLEGVTYKRNPTEKALNSHMLSLGTTGLKKSDGTYYYGKYDAGKNIKILYGTFDNGTIANANNLCRGSHLENITISSTVFRYLPDTACTKNSHSIELAGVKKVTIKNCKFYNNANCVFDNEAIQIESCSSDPTAKAHTGIADPLDDTQTSNVTITKCRFEGFNYGCGSNHLGPDDVCTNMKFTKNTFIGCQKYCICLYNYNKVTITGNKLKDCNSLLLDPKDHKSTKITQKKNKTIK